MESSLSRHGDMPIIPGGQASVLGYSVAPRFYPVGLDTELLNKKMPRGALGIALQHIVGFIMGNGYRGALVRLLPAAPGEEPYSWSYHIRGRQYGSANLRPQAPRVHREVHFQLLLRAQYYDNEYEDFVDALAQEGLMSLKVFAARVNQYDARDLHSAMDEQAAGEEDFPSVSAVRNALGWLGRNLA